MGLEVEQLESRNVPSVTFTMQYPYGVVEHYPVAPAGQEVVALQDAINAAPLLPGGSYWHPTPLMPVPQWSAGNVLDQFAQPFQWYELNQWTVPQPGGDAYTFVDKAEWLTLQNVLYGVGVQVQAPWDRWLAAIQQTVQQDDQQLFAVQDTYWTSVGRTAPPANTDPLALSGDSLVVQTLLKQKGN